MFTPTKHLRWVVRRVDGAVHLKLQQQWIDDDPRDEGAIKYDWRDVPTVEETP